MNASVYILNHTPIQVGQDLPPRGVPGTTKGIPFHSLRDLKHHICDLVMKQIGEIDEPLRTAFLVAYNFSEYDTAITIWRQIQSNNSKPLNFDAQWSSRPDLVL